MLQWFLEIFIVVVIDGIDYVCLIQKVNLDGSLIFYCVIEEGLVLCVVCGGDIFVNLEQVFECIQEEIGLLQFCIGCDCILWNLEIVWKQFIEEMGELFDCYKMIGFSIYGEQYGGIYVNQIFVGIVIGMLLEKVDG